MDKNNIGSRDDITMKIKKSTLIQVVILILFLGIIEPTSFIGTWIHSLCGVLRTVAFLISVLLYLQDKIYRELTENLLILFVILIGISSLLYSKNLTADYMYFAKNAFSVIVMGKYMMKRQPRNFCMMIGGILSLWLLIDAFTWNIPGLGGNPGEVAFSCFLGTKTTITYYLLPALAFDYALLMSSPKNKRFFAEVLLIMAVGGTIAYLIQMPISTTIVCLILQLLCMILVKKQMFIVKPIIKYGFFITSLLNILLIAGGTLGFLDYIMVNVLGESSDLDGRRQIWTMVIATFSRRPLMGFGMGSDIVFNVWQSNNASTHNYFLSILIYGGIVALIVYLLVILLFYKKNKPYLDRRISQFLMLTLIIMNLEGIAENYGFNEMTVCFWVLIANIRCLYEWKSLASGGNNETIGSYVRY